MWDCLIWKTDWSDGREGWLREGLRSDWGKARREREKFAVVELGPDIGQCVCAGDGGDHDYEDGKD